MKNVFFAGSFDPITNGHLDIIKRAYDIFGNINIIVMENINKKNYLFNKNIRKEIIEKVLKRNNINANIYVESNLLVDNIEKYNIDIFVRGLRNEIDFNYELIQFRVNNDLMKNKKVEFIYLYSQNENSYISSSVVRELISYNANIDSYVPTEVIEYLGEYGKQN